MSDAVTPFAVVPGTDFLVFACGGGANIEDMPSYKNDTQRQTGNLPGLARSNLNNRAVRQGAFVAAGVSTFVWEVLSIYVPDDGNLDNWVANFKAALQAFITPGGTLPGGPYLPIAGGTMYGDIQFISGATVNLANDTWLRAKDTGGTSHGMLKKGADNNHYISDGSAPYVIIGSTPLVGNGILWSARDTGGTAHGLLGILSDNNTYLNAYGSLYVNTPTVWYSGNVVTSNSRYYYSALASGAPVALLGVTAQNETLIASGCVSNTHLYCASGFQIQFHGTTVIYGNFYPQNNVNIAGALDVTGGTNLHGALSVSGSSNFYARLNVNSSVGATITGDIATNSIHIVSGGLTVDNSATINGSTYLQYLQVYNPGSSDPMRVFADAGRYARTRYEVGGTRVWSIGTFPSPGQFGIADETGGVVRILIDTSGSVTMYGQVNVGSLSSSGNVYANNQVVIGTNGLYLVDNGGGWIFTNNNFNSAGAIQANGGLISLGNGTINGSFNCYGLGYFASTLSVNGAFNCASSGYFGVNFQVAGTIYAQGTIQAGQSIVFSSASVLGWGSPWLQCNTGFLVGGDLQTQATLRIPFGNIVMQDAYNGTVYCSGIRVDGRGIQTFGNIRFDGSGGYTPGNQGTWITYQNIPSSRPYVVAVAGDRFGWYDATSSGAEVIPVNRWFGVFVGGIQVESGGQAYKPGGGFWADGSERRLKKDIEDYDTGLESVIRLRPRSFKFNGEAGTTDNDVRYYGLIADEVEGVMPEMLGQLDFIVSPKMIPGTDGRAAAFSDDLQRESVTTIDATALVYALVNSVKELAHRVATLEGRA